MLCFFGHNWLFSHRHYIRVRHDWFDRLCQSHCLIYPIRYQCLRDHFRLSLLDRWGRQGPLLIGATLMPIFMYTNAALFAARGLPAPPGGLNQTPEKSWAITGATGKAVIACTYLFVASYAPTWGPVSWIYPPELFPLRLHGKAVALTTASNWAFNFALSYFVPPSFVNIQWKTYILFGVFCTLMAVHVFFMSQKPPERLWKKSNPCLYQEIVPGRPKLNTAASALSNMARSILKSSLT
jgi:hypothetical protein